MESPLPILVMAEDPRLQADLVVALETTCRAHVWLASTPAQAVAWAEQHPVGLVLLDMDLPGLAALETCAALAERSDLIMTRMWILAGAGLPEPTREVLTCYADRLFPRGCSPAALCQEVLAESRRGPALRWVAD